MEGKKYIHPLLDEIPKLAEIAKQDNYHVTVAEEFVDVTCRKWYSTPILLQMVKKIIKIANETQALTIF